MRRLLLKFGILVAAGVMALALSPHKAEAQQIILPCVPSGTSCIPVSAANPLPTTGGGAFPPAGCVTANGVIFNNATPCDAAFTYAGAGGALKVPNSIINTAGNIVITPVGELRVVTNATVRLNSDTVFFNASNQTTVMGMLTAVASVGTNGVIAWVDNTGSAFPGRMGFGGFSSSFPAIARNGTQMRIVLADGSAAAPLSAGVISASLASATGTNAVCNTPGTETALTVQVWATGCAASSARFKEGIASIDRVKALDDVMRFEPVSYVYKPKDRNPCNCDMGADPHVGFTAEQVNSVDPQWVTYESDGVTPHAVKYNEMAPLLVAAIQQLKADNDNLRQELETLKARR